MGSTAWAAWRGFTLVPRHVRARPGASLDAGLARVAAAEVLSTTTPEAAFDAALALTRRTLHFGMNHRRSLHFSLAPREAHCVEYAHLFATLLTQWSRAHDDGLRVTVVRSQARLLGARLPMRGWADHDWVLVEGRGQRWYLDPTFDDMGLGRDLRAHVVGWDP